jgi:replication-associated recombination protein RarA
MPEPNALITRYRPAKWSQIVGHQAEVASLRDAIANDTVHAFLFSGKPGCGKTTLMRLVAQSLGAEGNDIDEVPAAVYTGVDDMRSLMQGLRYRPLTGEKKIIILDEVHRLSPQALDSILKIVEEPPEWAYFGFCTTELATVYKKCPAIKRRCLVIDLKEVDKSDIIDLLRDIRGEEQLEVEDGVLDVCAREARGSPGQAIANLALCSQARDRAEAAALLRAAEADTEAGDLARALMEGAPWERLQPILAKLAETDAESIRFAVRGYLGKILLSSTSSERAAGVASILEPFTTPFYDISDVAIAVCKIVFHQE